MNEVFVVFDCAPIVLEFLFRLRPLDLVTVIRPIVMRKVLAVFVPDVVGSDPKKWILHL